VSVASRRRPDACWSLAEPPPEQAIEMGDVAEADGERDVDDAQMREGRIAQHRVGALKSALRDMLGERLPSLLEQALDAAPGQAEPAGDGVDIEIRIAEAPRNLSQDRAQPRGLQPAPGDDLLSFGRRPESCGHEVQEVHSDYISQFGRRRPLRLESDAM